MHDQSKKSDNELAVLAIANSFYFTEIVERYEQPLSRYIKRLGYFDEAEVEDVLQNAFLKVYKNLNAYNYQLKFSSWIYRITHNVTMDYLRKKTVRPEGHYARVDEEFIDRIAGDIATDTAALDLESSSAISAGVGTLKEKYRDPVILYYFEDKSYEEISDILKIPPNTVATRLRRAREMLGKIINRNDYE